MAHAFSNWEPLFVPGVMFQESEEHPEARRNEGDAMQRVRDSRMLRRAETSRRITLRTAASRQGGSCLRYATTASQGVATLVDAPCLKASLPLLSSRASLTREERSEWSERRKRGDRRTERGRYERERDGRYRERRVGATVEEEDEEDDDDDDEEMMMKGERQKWRKTGEINRRLK